MSRALRHEVAEVPHHLDAHLLVHVVLRLLAALFEERIEVPALVLELQEPGHVVDAGAQEVDLLLRHIHIAGDQVQGRLDTVAEADVGHVRGLAERVAAHAHRVRVLEQNRLRLRHLIDVPRHIDQDGDRPQAPRDPAGAERVANALIDPVLERDLVIHLEGVHTAHLDQADDIVRVLDRLSAIEGGPDLRPEPILLHHALRERLHTTELRLGSTHQRVLRVLQRGRRQHVVQQRLGEDDAACSYDRDFHRSLAPFESLWRMRG